MRQPVPPPGSSPELQRFVDLLLRWNRSINLISRGDVADVWTRHVADSLQLADYWGDPPPARGIDLGSGAGFPGLVLSIRFGVVFHLIEQDQAKAAFLREAARITGAPVQVIAARIEDAIVPQAPLITARALAPLGLLLSYAEPLLLPGGICLFAKGRDVGTEIAQASRSWQMKLKRIPSRTDRMGVILRISGVARCSPNAAG
jgi:16S rRNA (guanine527-N7)-methyltransferase